MAGIPARTRLAVKARFQILLSRIQPGSREQQLFDQHQGTVKRRLSTVLAAHSVFPIGSYTRGSAIASYSDLDLLLVLKAQEVRWGQSWKSSTTVLNEVRDQLQARYQHTEVGRDGQAIVVQFADGKHPVDVVPGIFAEIVDKRPTYWIPDGVGGWLRTSPSAHNAFITSRDSLSAGKLKNVAKLVKYWRLCRSPELPLNSFHVELLLAQEEICIGVKTYGQCLYGLFQTLAQRKCAALQDPIGISGWIAAANTPAKREMVQSGVDFAADHARRALIGEQVGDTQEAVRQWDLVFNGHFPR